MRSLAGLKEMFGLTHKHIHTSIMLGILTSHLTMITAGCTSEYHQRHQLVISGDTVEQHDVYNTFSSVLQIMLIAKQQLITMVDSSNNIVMSRKNCGLIGNGMSYREIYQMNSSYDGIAKLTRDIIVGDQIMITSDTSSTLVNPAYYVQMLSELDITYSINMKADHALIVVKSGSDTIITNIDNKEYKDMEVVCTISQDFLNIRNIIIPSLSELHKIFRNILAAAKIFPQVLNINDMKVCLELRRLTFWNIMNMDGLKLERCLDTHGRRGKRNLLAWIDGSQIQIDAVSNALDATIDTFNQDLQEIENFNRKVATGYNHLHDEMVNVETYINDLRDVVILEEIKGDIRERQAFYHRMLLTQAINFNNIVLNSDTSELMRIINNCVYGELTCTISSCETSLNCGISQDSTGKNVLEIRREYAELHNSEGFLIHCEPVSPSHISTWHGCLAAGYGDKSLVLHKKIISMDDLSKDSIVNAEVRQIKDKEKILGNFVILPSKIICLNHIDAFRLDSKTLSCESLQAIEVNNNYTLAIGNNSYSHLKKTLSHKKTYKLEKGVYRGMNNEIGTLETSNFDSIMATVFLDKIGKVSHGKSTAFGVGMFLFVVFILSICYWKCECCRTNIDNCCLICMPNCVHDWREKRAMEKLQREREREERLNRLDPEGAENAQNHAIENGQAAAHESEDELAQGEHAAGPSRASSQIW